MHTRTSNTKGYLLVGLLGALGGGLAVVVATKAIPNMMSKMMARMMQSMMACIGQDGVEPEEM
jgi:hypothetical protein